MLAFTPFGFEIPLPFQRITSASPWAGSPSVLVDPTAQAALADVAATPLSEPGTRPAAGAVPTPARNRPGVAARARWSPARVRALIRRGVLTAFEHATHCAVAVWHQRENGSIELEAGSGKKLEPPPATALTSAIEPARWHIRGSKPATAACPVCQ